MANTSEPRIHDTALARRFWAKVRKAGPDECWEWQGARWGPPWEYGIFCVTRLRKVGAHRIALQLTTGRTAPPGLIVMHSCDNPPCCNPKHLSLGTVADNNADKVSKGRFRCVVGNLCHSSVLSPRAVREIRERFAAGETQTALAREYGLGQTSVSKVVRRKTWRHI